jgi:hypothetical protein
MTDDPNQPVCATCERPLFPVDDRAWQRKLEHERDLLREALRRAREIQDSLTSSCAGLRTRLEAEISKPIPIVKLEAGDAFTRDLMADRDEWRTQHESLLAMYKASEARVYGMMHERDALRVDLKFVREQTDSIAPLAAQAEILRTKCANQRKELHAISKSQTKAYDLYEGRIEAQLKTVIALKENLSGTQAKVIRIAAMLARFALPDECDDQCDKLVRDFCLHCVDILKRDHERAPDAT